MKKFIFLGLALILIAGGFLFYQFSIRTPDLNVTFPSQLEISAYKKYSFDFVIENPKWQSKAKDVAITSGSETIPVQVGPNNITISSGSSQTFKIELKNIPPGNYDLNLKIEGKPNIKISKTIPLKSQSIVGLDTYHVLGSIFWKEKVTPVGFEGKTVTVPPTMDLFIKYISEAGFVTKTLESQFTAETLKDLNILIIAKPEQPILDNEKEVLKNFISQGGSILLAGDGSFMGRTASSTETLNDLAKFLNLNLKFNNDYLEPTGWSKDIASHEITSGVEEINYKGCSLDISSPLISLAKYQNKDVYAVQNYEDGKLGAIGSWYVLGADKNWTEGCRQCQKLNLNLMKWLATPINMEQ